MKRRSQIDFPLLGETITNDNTLFSFFASFNSLPFPVFFHPSCLPSCMIHNSQIPHQTFFCDNYFSSFLVEWQLQFIIFSHFSVLTSAHSCAWPKPIIIHGKTVLLIYSFYFRSWISPVTGFPWVLYPFSFLQRFACSLTTVEGIRAGNRHFPHKYKLLPVMYIRKKGAASLLKTVPCSHSTVSFCVSTTPNIN